MQYLKIRSMTDEAIKTASAEGRLFRRVKLTKSKPLVTKPWALHDDGCKCCDGDGIYWPDCMNTIKDARSAIRNGRLFLGVE